MKRHACIDMRMVGVCVLLLASLSIANRLHNCRVFPDLPGLQGSQFLLPNQKAVWTQALTRQEIWGQFSSQDMSHGQHGQNSSFGFLFGAQLHVSFGAKEPRAIYFNTLPLN